MNRKCQWRGIRKPTDASTLGSLFMAERNHWIFFFGLYSCHWGPVHFPVRVNEILLLFFFYSTVSKFQQKFCNSHKNQICRWSILPTHSPPSFFGLTLWMWCPAGKCLNQWLMLSGRFIVLRISRMKALASLPCDICFWFGRFVFPEPSDIIGQNCVIHIILRSSW